MDSYRSYRNSGLQSTSWVEVEDQDVYEVESRVPLPRPFPLCSTLNEKNAVVVHTQISHINHRTNGHLLKVISKISLPTPPYTVSLRSPFQFVMVLWSDDSWVSFLAGAHQLFYYHLSRSGWCYYFPFPIMLYHTTFAQVDVNYGK